MLCSAQCLEVESSAAQLCAALRSSKPKDWSDTDGSGKLSRKELEASLGKIRPAMNALRPLFRNSFGHDPFSRECCGALPEITDEAHDVHDSCKDTVNSRSWKAWNHLDEASESIRFCVGYLWHRLFSVFSGVFAAFVRPPSTLVLEGRQWCLQLRRVRRLGRSTSGPGARRAWKANDVHKCYQSQKARLQVLIATTPCRLFGFSRLSGFGLGSGGLEIARTTGLSWTLLPEGSGI